MILLKCFGLQLHRLLLVTEISFGFSNVRENCVYFSTACFCFWGNKIQSLFFQKTSLLVLLLLLQYSRLHKYVPQNDLTLESFAWLVNLEGHLLSNPYSENIASAYWTRHLPSMALSSGFCLCTCVTLRLKFASIFRAFSIRMISS